MNKKNQALAQGNIGHTLLQYALPSAVSGLIGAVYNIVDQIFIGHIVGVAGNAATNVVFPIVTLTNAIALMAGVGTSALFNIYLGKKENEKAARVIGNGLSLMILAGILITLIVQIFMQPILLFFGGTPDTIHFATQYERIVSWGILFFIISTGGSAMIRADGSPTYSLISTLIGAILNIFLDALFMIVLPFGILGAAWATLISQIVSGILVIAYFIFHLQNVSLNIQHLFPSLTGYYAVFKSGSGPFLNHLSMTVVQVLLNKALVKWGAASIYGSNIPLAVSGIVTKVSSITSAIVIGIAQGAQPIIGYNYGAKNYKRVRQTGNLAILSVLGFSFFVFLCFQFFPTQITMLFGISDELIYEFASIYFRIFMMLICISGLQITVGNFFTALGKPMMSILISASRQLVAFPIFLALLPRIWGLNGVLISGPLSDGICAIIAALTFHAECKRLKLLETKNM